MPDQFIADALSAAKAFLWIKRVDPKKMGKVARLRLWLNSDFSSTCQRVNVHTMKIGWHLHPFREQDIHRPIQPISMGEFLRLLGDELRERDKL